MMLWPILISVLSTTGLIVKYDLLFIGCGMINFVFFLMFFNEKCNQENEVEYAEIRYEVKNPEGIIRKKRLKNIALRIVLFIILVGILGWLFTWQLFVWSGMVFGYYLIPKVIGINNKKGKQRLTGYFI